MDKIKNLLNKTGAILTRIFGVGDISLMRILSAITVIDVLTVWTIKCFKVIGLADIPSGVQVLFVAAIGGKALQRFAEKANDNTQTQQEQAQ